jgi:hypothetical protein
MMNGRRFLPMLVAALTMGVQPGEPLPQLPKDKEGRRRFRNRYNRVKRRMLRRPSERERYFKAHFHEFAVQAERDYRSAIDRRKPVPGTSRRVLRYLGLNVAPGQKTERVLRKARSA